MIRGIGILLEILLLIIVSIILIPTTFIVALISKSVAQKISQSLVYFFASLTLLICGTKLEIIGKENLPDEPCLYIGNHRSYFDVIISMVFIREKTFYVAKKAIGKIPILHFFMLKMGCLLLDREDLKQSLQVILKAIEQVKNGYSCFIFPEGTRTTTENHEMLPFKEGSFKIATKSNVPICPITFINTRAIYENQAPKFKKAHITIVIDKPVYIDKLELNEKKFIGAYCQNIINKNLEKYVK